MPSSSTLPYFRLIAEEQISQSIKHFRVLDHLRNLSDINHLILLHHIDIGTRCKVIDVDPIAGKLRGVLNPFVITHTIFGQSFYLIPLGGFHIDIKETVIKDFIFRDICNISAKPKPRPFPRHCTKRRLAFIAEFFSSNHRFIKFKRPINSVRASNFIVLSIIDKFDTSL